MSFDKSMLTVAENDEGRGGQGEGETGGGEMVPLSACWEGEVGGGGNQVVRHDGVFILWGLLGQTSDT